MKKMVFLLLSFLINTSCYALTLSYPSVDSQGRELNSQIIVTAQQNNVLALEIIGGLPEPAYNGEYYLKQLQVNADNSLQTQGVFIAPFLYVLVPTTVTYQKILIDVSRIYVFRWLETTQQLQLSHFVQEGSFTGVNPCEESDAVGLLCGDAQTQFKTEVIEFSSPVFYQLQPSF